MKKIRIRTVINLEGGGGPGDLGNVLALLHYWVAHQLFISGVMISLYVPHHDVILFLSS